jgi:hypothetical protein
MFRPGHESPGVAQACSTIFQPSSVQVYLAVSGPLWLPVSDLVDIAVDGSRLYAVARYVPNGGLALLTFSQLGNPTFELLSESPAATDVAGVTGPWFFWSAGGMFRVPRL